MACESRRLGVVHPPRHVPALYSPHAHTFQSVSALGRVLTKTCSPKPVHNGPGQKYLPLRGQMRHHTEFRHCWRARDLRKHCPLLDVVSTFAVTGAHQLCPRCARQSLPSCRTTVLSLIVLETCGSSPANETRLSLQTQRWLRLTRDPLTLRRGVSPSARIVYLARLQPQ